MCVTDDAVDFVLRPEHHRGGIITSLQQLLGKVEPGMGKPTGSGHLVPHFDDWLTDHAFREIAEVPQDRPEGFRFGDRPGM